MDLVWHLHVCNAISGLRNLYEADIVEHVKLNQRTKSESGE